MLVPTWWISPWMNCTIFTPCFSQRHHRNPSLSMYGPTSKILPIERSKFGGVVSESHARANSKTFYINESKFSRVLSLIPAFGVDFRGCPFKKSKILCVFWRRRDTGSCCGLETEIRRTILGKFRFVDRTKGKREQKAADRSRDSQKRGKRLLVGRGKQGGGGVRRRVGNADSQRTRAQTSSSMGDSGRGSVEALPRRCPFSAEKGDVADEQGCLPPFSHHLSSRTLTPVQCLLQGKLRYAQPPVPQSLTAEPSLSLSLSCVCNLVYFPCVCSASGPREMMLYWSAP